MKQDSACDGNHETAGLLDRLVSGDLDEAGRRRTLAWLEDDPQRWRQCGLAFLEAQVWSQAMDGWCAEEPSRRIAAPAPLSAPPRRSRPAVTSRAILVSCAVAAFGLGLVAGEAFRRPARPMDDAQTQAVEPRGADSRTSEAPAQHSPSKAPILASVPVKPFGSGPSASVQIPVVPAGPEADAEPRSSGIPEHVRREWERRGFRIDSQRRYVLARLPDGEQVAVPVEHINVSPLPTQVY
ncbi:MAG TPA: hypothetical protein VML55_10575 [Planctomycetaceae bacterium]|nr:hypothetical protein [Planctomycetaceae bacterium]